MADPNKVNCLVGCPSAVRNPHGARPGGRTEGRDFRSQAPGAFGGCWDTGKGASWRPVESGTRG